MKKIFIVTFIGTLALGCTSAPPQWTPREPSSVISTTEDEPPNIQEVLTAADYRLLIRTALKSLQKKCAAPKHEAHLLSAFQNQTSSELDISLLRRELIDILHANGVAIIDKESREDIHNEYIYESETGYTNPEQAIVNGRQSGVRHLIRTVINSRTETGEDNRFVRYRMSLQFLNSESSEIECTGVGEIRKHYYRDRTAW
jgi:hypothetical protein